MKLTSSTLVVSGLASLATAQSDITCQDGAHVIVARASEEKPGFGFLGAVKDMILSQIPNSDAVAVPYPAVIQGPNITYPQSVQQGDGNMTLLVTQYGDACPNSKMILMGYSQGAQVVADVLLGQDYAKFPAFGDKPGIDQKYIDNVAAVIMMGDPSNVKGVSVLYGNSTRNGFFPRSNTDKWASTGLANRTRSYCDADDFYCDSGKAPNSHQIHVGYVPEYGVQAAAFAVDHYKAATGSGSSGGEGSSSSLTPTLGGGAVPTTTGSRNPGATGASNTATPPASGTNGAPMATSTGAASTLKAEGVAYLLAGLMGFGMISGITL